MALKTYVYIYLYFVLRWARVCAVTPLSPRGPNHHELGSWGLGHVVPLPWGASLENHHDGVLLGEWCRIAPVRSLIELGDPGEGP
jgi:hypothetical protein